MHEEEIPTKEPNTGVIDFIKELYLRFALPSPHFFQVIQAVGMICAGIGFLPVLLDMLHITLTPIFSKYLSQALVIAGLLTKLLAKLPVEHATKTAYTTDKMPFTLASKEKKSEDEKT